VVKDFKEYKKKAERMKIKEEKISSLKVS